MTTESDATHETIRIRPRYYRLYTDPGTELREDNYRYAEVEWDMPLRDAAIVCVDVWNEHFSIDTHERDDRVTRENIAPLVNMCRKAGMLVIHAPADPVASKHPNVAPPLDVDTRHWPYRSKTPIPAEWPPPDFRKKKGRYAQYARPEEPQQAERAYRRDNTRDFHSDVKPEGNEPVIRNGDELHLLCAERKIVNLFYVGFNTNACIVWRNYGTIAMQMRGFNIILVRDCTSGMETHETNKEMVCTRGMIATLEQHCGYSIVSTELIAAMRQEGGKISTEGSEGRKETSSFNLPRRDNGAKGTTCF